MNITQTVWGFIDRRDQRLMHWFNHWSAPRWVRFWMIMATRLGDGYIWYALGVLILLFGGQKRYAAAGAASTLLLPGLWFSKL